MKHEKSQIVTPPRNFKMLFVALLCVALLLPMMAVPVRASGVHEVRQNISTQTASNESSVRMTLNTTPLEMSEFDGGETMQSSLSYTIIQGTILTIQTGVQPAEGSIVRTSFSMSNWQQDYMRDYITHVASSTETRFTHDAGNRFIITNDGQQATFVFDTHGHFSLEIGITHESRPVGGSGIGIHSIASGAGIPISFNVVVAEVAPAPTISWEEIPWGEWTITYLMVDSVVPFNQVRLYANGEFVSENTIHATNEIFTDYRRGLRIFHDILSAGTYDLQIAVMYGGRASELSNAVLFTSFYQGPMPQATGLALNDAILTWNPAPTAYGHNFDLERYTISEWGGNNFWSWIFVGSYEPFNEITNRFDLRTLGIHDWETDEFKPHAWEAGNYRIRVRTHGRPTESVNDPFYSSTLSEPLYFSYPFGSEANALAPQPAPIVPLPQPTPTPTPQPTPAPEPPAPVVIVPVAITGLVTTERLVTTIPPMPVAGQDLHYTVQYGETLAGIAFNFYGSMQSDVIDRIFAANATLLREYGLQAGMVITLPAQGLRQPVVQAQLSNAAGVYLVRAGDTLGSIAMHFFGSSAYWGRIWEANQPRIGSNNMIFEGQWLIIPR